jgi:hypothetical protein
LPDLYDRRTSDLKSRIIISFTTDDVYKEGP